MAEDMAHSVGGEMLPPQSPIDVPLPPNNNNSHWKTALVLVGSVLGGIAEGAFSNYLQTRGFVSVLVARIFLGVCWVATTALIVVFVMAFGVKNRSLTIGLAIGMLTVILGGLEVTASRVKQETTVTSNTDSATASSVPKSSLPPQSTGYQTANPKEDEVRIVFKNSGFFTEKRRNVIRKDLRGFRGYLLSLQLPAPIEVPPLGVAPDKYDASSGKILYPPRYQDFKIGQGAINSGDWEYWVTELYCEFSLRPIFGTTDVPADWFVHPETHPGMVWAPYFCWYLAGSFLGSLPKEMDQPNVEAFWEIRNKLGKSLADSIIAYGALAFSDSPARGVFPPGDAYVYNRLLDGNSVVDNDGSNIAVIKKAWDERDNRFVQRQFSKLKAKQKQDSRTQVDK